MVVGVLVEISHQNVDKVFDYQVRDELKGKIKIGIRVEVPFGRQTLEGFVLEIKRDSSFDQLKEIYRIIDDEVILTEELIELGKRMQQQTMSTLISCYQAMLPKALKASKNSNVSKKYETFYRLGDISFTSFNETQQKIIDLFQDRKLIPRKELLSISSSSVKTLLSKNILIEEKKEQYRMSYQEKESVFIQLTEEQQEVVSQVSLDSNNIYLLHGVTGSGKTEVYIKLIEKVLASNKTAIVLVPEISLTMQLISRFERVFGKKIATFHSALSDGERYDEYRRIRRGEVSVVIGARSAVFVPLSNLGLIVIDEEHSDSYKQDHNPRYDAKKMAMERSKMNHFPVVMGSATPSLDSYARAKKKVYQLLQLPNRVNHHSLPKVQIIDMSEELKYGKGHFSRALLTEIKNTLEKKEQIILLLNRRGYSSFISCKNCAHTIKCPNCDITLTYHKNSNILRCHYCGYGTKMVMECPNCHENSMTPLGVGTEKIEEEVHKIFDGAKILRMDIDTTSRKGSHKKMIEAFKNHEYDILLGTQIVAKGLDFPLVTLVGVMNADTSLNIPDFRSSENTFDLLSQVSGRSGRGEKNGSVMIQTFNKEHYAIKYAKSHDYVGFYQEEMVIRKCLKYPPFYYLCYLKISSKDELLAQKESVKIKKALERNLSSMIILGPSPAFLFKINNVYHYSIIIKYKKEENLREVLTLIINHYKLNKNITIQIDFNPTHF